MESVWNDPRTYISLLALILSGYLGIREIRKSRPKLKIAYHTGRIIDENGNDSEPVIFITAVNTGKGKIVVNGFSWIHKNKEMTYITDPHWFPIDFPKTLEEGDNLDISISCNEFQELHSTNKIDKLFFSDNTAKKWILKIKSHDMENWLRADSLNIGGWRVKGEEFREFTSFWSSKKATIERAPKPF